MLQLVTMTNVGIDYSTSSPCICVNVRNDYDFYYLTRTQKFARTIDVEFGIMEGARLPKQFNSRIEQYTFIANWAMDILSRYHIDHVWLEDYAFAATGRVFHIGENTGLLKYKIFRRDIPYTTVPPTTVKRSSIGKGNASKEEAILKFNQDFNIDLNEILDSTTMNPASDIADSYHICNHGIQEKIAVI